MQRGHSFHVQLSLPSFRPQPVIFAIYFLAVIILPASLALSFNGLRMASGLDEGHA